MLTLRTLRYLASLVATDNVKHNWVVSSVDAVGLGFHPRANQIGTVSPMARHSSELCCPGAKF